MRFVSIDNIKVGSTLSKTIYNENNKPLLREGVLLSINTIQKLKEMGYRGLYINDDLSKDIKIEELISNVSKKATIDALKSLNIDDAVKSAEMIVEDLSSKNDILFNMLNMGDEVSRNIYNHSLNVCQFSVAIGKSLGYSKDKLIDLAVSALLHDIGKMCMDKKQVLDTNISSFLRKKCNISGNINEYEVQKHPLYGYNLLLNNPNVKATSKQGILFHHEKEDGTGLFCSAMGISPTKIYPYAKIIHICDTYDHLISGDKEKLAMSPSEAYEFLNAGCGTDFNTEYVSVFQKIIPAYPIGVTVRLSNGLLGIVYEINKDLPLRPKIILENGKKVDLTKILNITIEKIQLYDDQVKENISESVVK